MAERNPAPACEGPGYLIEQSHVLEWDFVQRNAQPGATGLPVYRIAGPGLSRHHPQIAVWNESDAENVARIAAIAFEAGLQAGKKEIRDALGIKDCLRCSER